MFSNAKDDFPIKPKLISCNQQVVQVLALVPSLGGLIDLVQKLGVFKRSQDLIGAKAENFADPNLHMEVILDPNSNPDKTKSSRDRGTRLEWPERGMVRQPHRFSIDTQMCVQKLTTRKVRQIGHSAWHLCACMYCVSPTETKPYSKGVQTA